MYTFKWCNFAAGVATVAGVVLSFRITGFALAAVLTLVVAGMAGVLTADAQAASAQAAGVQAAGRSTLELTFQNEAGQNEDAQPVGDGLRVSDLTAGESYAATDGAPLPIVIPSDTETELRIEPGGGARVSAVTCEGASRAKTVISPSGTRLFITPGESVVSCTVEIANELPVTGGVDQGLFLTAAAWLCAGALFCGVSRSVTSA